MRVLTNVSFLSLEFDFGSKGIIDARVFVEIDNNGEVQHVEHKLQLQDVSFNDFLSAEQITQNTQVGDNFSSFIQNFRKLITLKIASDLGLDVADGEYTKVTPTRELVKSLEISQSEQDQVIMGILVGGINQ